MYDTGNRCLATVVYACHSPCNRTGGRYSSEKRGDDIGYALTDEFSI